MNKTLVLLISFCIALTVSFAQAAPITLTFDGAAIAPYRSWSESGFRIATIDNSANLSPYPSGYGITNGMSGRDKDLILTYGGGAFDLYGLLSWYAYPSLSSITATADNGTSFTFIGNYSHTRPLGTGPEYIDFGDSFVNVSSVTFSYARVFSFDNIQLDNVANSYIADPVPEPSTILLLGSGLLGLGWYGRKRKKA